MCAVSAIGDNYSRQLPWIWPGTVPYPGPVSIPLEPDSFEKKVTRQEFDALKQKVEEMAEELRKAKAQDVADGNPDCEMEDKVKVIKEIARLVGVDLGDVFSD